MQANGARKFRDYPDFIINYETEPGSGIGFLAGWRGDDGDKYMRGEPNPRQWEMYAQNNCVHHHALPPSYQYMRNWNRGYMEWAQRLRIRRYSDPVIVQIYSEVMQKFRLAAMERGPGRKPPAHLRERIATYFDPLPFWYAPLEAQATDRTRFPLAAVTQRPMAMYHSWDSQNAWLRQIHAHNDLYVNPEVARAAGIVDGGWMWVESPWGRVRCQSRLFRGRRAWHRVDVECDRQSRGRVASRARMRTNRERGFLLNHLIADELAGSDGGPPFQLRPDHRTGGAGTTCASHPPGRHRRAADDVAAIRAGAAAPGTARRVPDWQAWFAGRTSRR